MGAFEIAMDWELFWVIVVTLNKILNYFRDYFGRQGWSFGYRFWLLTPLIAAVIMVANPPATTK